MKQEDNATQDAQEATLAEAIRALSTISNHEITMLISKRINTLKGLCVNALYDSVDCI